MLFIIEYESLICACEGVRVALADSALDILRYTFSGLGFRVKHCLGFRVKRFKVSVQTRLGFLVFSCGFANWR